MDWFDLAEYCSAPCGSRSGDVLSALATIKVEKALAIGVATDILFPLQQQEQIADGLRAGGADATFLPLPSPQGHDAFLVDIERFGPAVANFLATL
jgi:homoserine O-acetyltransferase